MNAPRWAPEELTEMRPTPAPAVDPPSSVPPMVDADAEERAFQRGFAEGVAVGAAREAERLVETKRALEEALDHLEQARPAWLDNVTKNLQALAVAIAQHIIGRELQTDVDTIQELVVRALGQFPLEVPVTIRMHPRDLSNLSAAALEGEGGDLAAGREVRWRPDPTMEPGGCMVEGPERLVDGRVDKALLRIYHELATND